jgi:TRAP-type C4-dicarboxylate transport system substrate-binding protein
MAGSCGVEVWMGFRQIYSNREEIRNVADVLRRIISFPGDPVSAIF